MLRLDTFERDDAPWFMLDVEYWRAVVASREDKRGGRDDKASGSRSCGNRKRAVVRV